MSSSARLRTPLWACAAAVLWGAPLGAAAEGTITSTPAALAAATATDTLDAATLAEIGGALAADTPPPAPAPSTASQVVGALQSMLPDIALILDVALAGFSEEENLQTGGHDPTVSGFNLQQLEMSIHGKVDAYFQLDANIVFAAFGVEVEEAYATSLALPYQLQVRAGQFLTRFGRINNTHPHAWDFVDQPFAIGRVFGGEGNRGLGVEASWLTPLPWYVEVLASSTMATGEATARSFYGSEDLGVRSPLDLQTTVALEQFFPLSEDLSLMTGLSLATGPNAAGRSTRTDVYGVDLYLRYRPVTEESSLVVTLTSEWLYRRRQITRDLLQDVSSYTQVMLRFAPRWAVAARYELGTPATGELAAADGAVDPLDPEWTSSRQRISGNLTFWPTEFSRLRLQGSVDLPAWRDDPIWAVFLAAEFNVGAHGAHAF
jgi:hypothetical protein